jgi:hypothetical protein
VPIPMRRARGAKAATSWRYSFAVGRGFDSRRHKQNRRARGFHKPGDVEDRLGYYLGKITR